jgi:tetratricopeptide (TPR) repeat protein
MDHPNIARVLDAGATEAGRPFFVMELVRGIPITEYCDTEKLDTSQRLDLLISVCNAVQHAHQKGVIHRDIKPSNVLITLHDGVPVPKVIDFGIAKATNAELTEKTLFTQHRQMIGTPAYMSPEQAEMSGLDVDTRADIYSLGVLTYELLTGTTPFDATKLGSAGYNEMVRIIREEEPHKPSTRISALSSPLHQEPEPRRCGQNRARKEPVISGTTKFITDRRSTAENIAKQRRTDPAALRKLLRGDLDWIVMKCLEKDRRRRYETANGLAMDIRRHLSNEPVVARPPSRPYRMRKFIQRNRAAVAGATTVSAVLVLGIIATSAVMVWALHQRDRAVVAEGAASQRAAEAEAVTNFLSDMLAEVDPEQSGKDVSVRQVLDRASKAIGDSFHDKPLVEARLRAAIGQAYRELGFYEDAERHLPVAMEIRRRVLGDDHVETIRSVGALTNLRFRQERFAEADVLNHRRLEQARRSLGEEHAEALSAMNMAASLLNQDGRHAEALVQFRRLLDVARRVLGADHPDTIRAMHNVATTLTELGRFPEAVELFRQTLEVERRVLGPEHPRTLLTMSAFALNQVRLGNWSGAADLLERVLPSQRRVLGEDHPRTRDAVAILAHVYVQLDRLHEAASLLDQEAQRRAFGDGEKHALDLLSARTSLYRKQGRYAEALEACGRLCVAGPRVWGETAPATASALNECAWTLVTAEPPELRDPMAALPLAESACMLEEKAGGAGLFEHLDTLALAQHLSGRTNAAIETQERACRLLPQDQHDGSDYQGRLVTLYLSAGRTDDAARVASRRFEGLRRLAAQENAPPRLLNAYARELLTAEPADRRNPEEGLAVAQRACTQAENQGMWSLFEYLDTLALAQHAVGDTSKAIETQKRALSLTPPDHYKHKGFEQRLAAYEAALRLPERAPASPDAPAGRR